MIKNIGEFNQLLRAQNPVEWTDKSLKKMEQSNVPNLGNDNVDYFKLPHRINEGEFNQFNEIRNEKTFGDFLFESVAKVNELQQEANVAVEKLATGQSQNLHETMLIVEQAEIAYKTMNQIRSKVIDAYKEIMKIQV